MKIIKCEDMQKTNLSFIRSYPFVTQDFYKDICHFVVDEYGGRKNNNYLVGNGLFCKTDFLIQQQLTIDADCVLFTGHSDFEISHDIVLFTGHSSFKISSVELNSAISKWYAINCNIENPIIEPVILGLGDQRYAHGDIGIVIEELSRDVKKDNMLYANFNPETNGTARNKCLQCTGNKITLRESNLEFKQYMSSVHKSFFQLCPQGGGYDTHRIYESLLCKCVPIVTKHLYLRAYKGWPLLIVDRWEDVPDLTETLYNEIMDGFDISELLIPSYLKRIGVRI